MLSSMQISRLCSFLLLLLLLTFRISPSNGFNSTAVKADVGVILDLQTPVGKIFKTCISMAVEDFYLKKSYSTMIVPHFVDSSSDVVDAASAAIDLLKNTQVMAIFGPQRSTQAEFVIEIGDKVKVPIISPATSPSLSPQESPYFIRSSWCSSSQARAVASIIENFGWREVVLVYEDGNYGSGLLPFLTDDLLQSNAVVSNMTSVSTSANNDLILEHLLKLKNMQTRVFVVHMLPPLASRFFKMAQSIGMMTEGYVWIVTEVLTSLLDSLDLVTIEAMQGVVGVKAHIPSSSGVRNFTSRWKKRFYEEYPEMERTELNVFGLWAYDSIVALAEGVKRVGVASPKFEKPAKTGNLTDLEAIGTSNSGPLLVTLIKNFTSKGLSGDFKISNGELQPSVFEIVNVLGNGVSRVGFWTQDHGISKRLNFGNDTSRYLGAVVWPGQTSNTPRGWEITQNARKLRVGVPMKCRTSELVNVARDEETNEVKVTGFCIDVFKEATGSLPYHVEFEFIPFKNAEQNSTAYHYDSLIEQVHLKNFDAVVADVTISAKRTQMADFTISYIDSGIATVVPMEDNSKENAWIFMRPLTKELWFTIAGFFILTGFVVWALEHGMNEEFRGQPHKQVGMIFWFAFSTLVFAHRTSNSGPLLASLIRNFTSKGLSGDFKISNGELQPSVFEIVNVLGNGASRVGFWTQGDGISRRLNLGNDTKESLGAVVWPGQTSDTPRGWEVTANARKLRVGVPMKWRTSELVSVTRDEETNEVNATGFCIDVFKEAMKLLPYHVEYEFVPFENAEPNSTGGYHYDSLIEQLLLKNFDAVVADVTISAKRTQMADFTISYIDSGISTVVPIEEKSKENAWNFMKPLTKGLWFTIAGFFIFTGFVVWALEHGVNEEFRGKPHNQVGMIFWFAFSTLVFAHKEKVKSNLSRFVVIIWLFVVLVLTSSYTANLTSMLTVQQLDATDFHDMSRKGEYIGFKESSLVRTVLDSSSSDNSKFRVLNSFEEYDEALSLGTRKGGVGAIIDNLPSIRLFLSKYCHKYTMTGKTYRNSGFGFPFQRGSPLAPDVSRTIMQMKENGKMDEISRKWFGEEEGCSQRNGTAENTKSLTVSHFKGLFFISGLSSFSAISIFLCIFLHKNRHVLTSDASLKEKLHELVQVFDRRRDNKSLPVLNKSRSDQEETVAAAERSISSCYAEQGRWSTIELVVTRA